MLTRQQAEAALTHVASTLLRAPADSPIMCAFKIEGIRSIDDLLSTPEDQIDSFTYIDPDTTTEADLPRGDQNRIQLLLHYAQWRINENRPIQEMDWLSITGEEFMMYRMTPHLQKEPSDPLT
jgi:hypothetical protein